MKPNGINTAIIIGAPRSGTNMLRDVLTSIDGISTWPCDEINYIWRHGNVRYPSDEYPASLATQKVKKYLRASFKNFASKGELSVLVEKTCASSLRVPFVNKVFPDAIYIFIYRDGIDSTGSAKLRWTAKLNIPYLLEKVRFVPITDLPYYGFRYFWARIHRLFSREKRLAFWGPTLDGMQGILKKHSLNEVCALQWKRCVDKADEAFSNMPEHKVFRVCYEDFVQNPRHELAKIMQFIGLGVTEEEISDAVKDVSSESLGKGRKLLGEQEVKKLEDLVGDSLKRYGYL